jgi:hypothetical protein
MKKALLLLLIPFISFSQNLSIVDSQTDMPVKGVELKTYHLIDKDNAPLVPNGILKLKWNESQTKFIPKIYQYNSNTYTVFSKHGYETDTFYSGKFKEKNYVIKLMRDKIHDDYYVKLFETDQKNKLNQSQLNKLQSDIAVEGIEEIKKRNGYYSYITHKVNDIHLAITQLKRIQDYKHPFIKKPYLLHTKNKKVYFKLQFGVISHTPLENLIPQYSQMLKGVYSITPVLTVDKYHRIVSVQEYNNFTDAQADFLQKLTFQNPSLPAVAIAYEKDKTHIDVISQLRIK